MEPSTPVQVDVYVCKLCQQPFTRTHTVVKHVQQSHFNPSINPDDCYTILALGTVVALAPLGARRAKNYDCLHCGLTFKRMPMSDHVCVAPDGSLSCVTHQASGKTIQKREAEEYFLLGKKGRICEACGRVFQYRPDFNRHMVEAHGLPMKRWYPCDECDRSFQFPNLVRRHKAEAHSPRSLSTHICDYCGSKFASRVAMETHRRRIHTEGVRYKCEICPKKFFARSELIVHTKVHFGISQYECSVCHKQFASSYNLKTHFRIHSGEKPYACNHCDASFAQKNSLNVHMKKHSDFPGILNSVSVPRVHKGSEGLQ